MAENPWAQMPPNAKRRIEDWSERNLFWITDINGSYGFYIQSSTPFEDDATKLKLKGIALAKRSTDEGADFFLVLSRKEDWELFYVLCSDLISAAIETMDDPRMIAAVERRLRRWQQLLRSDLQKTLAIETQMGLFSELLCLRDVIAPRIGFDLAIKRWGGPDSDKQDFVCDSAAVEVKSYPASKGPSVLISSMQQLWTDKEHMYLVAYGLSPSDAGTTVEDLAKEILASIQGKEDLEELFVAKIGQYGFIPELHSLDLQKFIHDSVRAYKVAEKFPRIDPEIVSPSITTVKYVIDLSRTSQFEIQSDGLLL